MLSDNPMTLSAVQHLPPIDEPTTTPLFEGSTPSLSALVSHELRNALLAATSLLELDASPSHDARRARELVKQAHALTSLLHESLTDAYRSRPVPLALEDWLPAVMHRLVRQLPEGIHASCDVAPDLPTITADPDALALVLRTLLVNAATAQRGVGQVRVSARRARDSNQADDVVEILVRDRGPGFTREALSSLFQVSARPDPTRERSGLGLLLARQILRQQGGDLRCLSAINPGGVLAIQLPASRSAT
jgi:two-component system C4-dicarboxylate transport sensor histidine kinase DctB